MTKALFIARKLFAELVYDVQALEGMPFTFPEVETYLQGITVGGHKVTDEQKLKQQAEAWRLLIDTVEADRFGLTRELACGLQAVLAKDEALEPGHFRTGRVGIAGTTYQPPEAVELDGLFEQVVALATSTPDILRAAVRLHLDFARNQFFWDGNKRTGLLMASGLLLSHDLPPLSIPAKRLHEYNGGMIRFYETGDPAEMLTFLQDCHARLGERFGM